MRESIGSAQLYNIIIVFFFIVVAFLFATISYARAFRVNTIIVNTIEKYEGYNQLAWNTIEKHLTTLAYNVPSNTMCPVRDGLQSLTTISNWKYCVYRESNTFAFDDITLTYDQYTIITYISFDFPVVRDQIQIPVIGKTTQIYRL